MNKFIKKTFFNPNSGFTLIELLVVVLIIGILAAAAIAQYQKVVDKARYSKVISMTHTLKNAAEVYFMANGSYPSRIDMIDIQGPADCSFPANDNIVLCADSWYDILDNSTKTVNGYTYPRYVSTTPGSLNVGYRVWLDQSPKPGQRECFGGGERGARLCESMGGTKQGSSYILP